MVHESCAQAFGVNTFQQAVPRLFDSSGEQRSHAITGQT